MNIHFSLKYDTVWGESLVLRAGRRSFPMRWCGGGMWETTLTGRDLHIGEKYSYALVRDGEILRTEWRGHTLVLPEGTKEATVRDRWMERPADSAFWSSAFKDVIFGRGERKTAAQKGRVILRAAVPAIRPGEALAIAGSGRKLGAWKKVNILDDSCFPVWEIAVDETEAFEYKYLIVDRKTKGIIHWEEGPNHFSGDVPGKGGALVIADAVPSFPLRPWRGAGTAIPVFSLRTRDSFGIGEFHDLKKMVDWEVATGQNIIQLLPVNDTTMTGTWQDSYPYNSVSSFALHPQFIHLPEAGVRVDKKYRDLRDELNALSQVDYERVNNEKLRLLREVFSEASASLPDNVQYNTFLAANELWLKPYAVFCCLRDENGTADFSKWGKWAKYSPKKADEYAAAHPDEVSFWCWVQFLLDVQLKDAVAYAHKNNVAIKGDLPIGVSRTSADAWTNPDLFNLDMQAGAPPDAFSADGQNWGFPTYNWDRMAEDGFAWWKARLRKMGDYFDAYRIDHILGFFRIWEIPSEYKSGLMGHFSPALPYSGDELRGRGFDMNLFIEDPRRKDWWHPRIDAKGDGAFTELYNDYFYRRHNAFWKESAMKKLPALLRSTAMLSCGEDLGMIPDCVASVMDELNILSLEIQRMPKDPHDDFADPAAYPYYCVCTTGTHDTSPLRAWWEEDRALTGRYYNSMMHCSGDAPWFCEPWAAEIIIKSHLSSPAMLAILPLQDWLAIDGDIRYQGNPADERINIPAIPRHYWRYRMHLTLEDLIAESAFNSRLRALILDSARGV